MRRAVAKLVVQAALITAEQRKVLAAQRLPSGVWYAIVDDGKLWFEAMRTAYGVLVQWARQPIQLLDGMTAPSALAAMKWKEVGQEEVLELDLDARRQQVTDIRSQYKRAARKMLLGSASPTAELLAECKSLGIGGRASFDGVSVGKKMGTATYVHRDYQSVFPGTLPAAGRLPRDFDYAVVKADSSSGCFSFIECADFDTAPEPTVGRSARVCGEKVTWRAANEDPQIYHHKWSMVGDDYDGFDVAESMRRSIAWKSVVGKNAALSSRIGTKSVWEKEVLPRLGNSLDCESSVQYALGMGALPIPKTSPKSTPDPELLHLQEAWQKYEGTFKPKQKALTTDEYRKVYPYLKELNNRERKNFTAAGEKAMKASGVWYGDTVEWHAVGSFFDLSVYRGTIVESATGPKVRLDKPVAGKTSIRWHKGFKKA